MSKHSLVIGCLGALALGAAAGAQAQDTNTASQAVGPPQLRNFSLEGRRQVVQPAPATPPATEAPAPATTRPARPVAERPGPDRTASAPRRQPSAAPAAPSQDNSQAVERPVAEAPNPFVPPAAPASESPAPASASAPAAQDRGAFSWYYALPAAALALVGLALVRRRRRAGAEPVTELVPAEAAPPPVPRPDPVPRPWLELALKADRASFTDVEAELQFELEISNKGGSAARNLRIDVKMFNGGAEQDNDIGAFFRTAGRETTKLRLPEVAAGVSGIIRGSVAIARDDIRAMRLDERLLFVPVVAVNALYDWGEGRTGQTSKSYVVGREIERSADKMGAFRVDQGPRVWRTVSQRPHKLAKRV